jgi:hypothetical protein
MAAAEPTAARDGYLDVAGLEEVSYRELTDRYTWLLTTIGSVRPETDHPGIRAAALALVAVLTELHNRARAYAVHRDRWYWCSCGFGCQGLAAFEQHTDQYPPGAQDSENHDEVPEEFLEQEAERYFADLNVLAGQEGGDGPAR